ncbi:MAG: hypothetical protein AB7S50_09325 [Bacteroidales bacterium]
MEKKLSITLGIILLLVSIGAIPAGYSMIVQPDGSDLGMTTDLLAGSVFSDFFIPGIFLFTVNGLFNLISSILSFYRFKYTYLLGFLLGTAMIIWISVQVYSVGLNHILQPIYFVIGLIEMSLSIWLYKLVKLKTM